MSTADEVPFGSRAPNILSGTVGCAGFDRYIVRTVLAAQGGAPRKERPKQSGTAIKAFIVPVFSGAVWKSRGFLFLLSFPLWHSRPRGISDRSHQ